MTEAVYDLSEAPASFNFIEFLVAAKTQGATGILFDGTKGIKLKYSPDQTIERIESILIPSCQFAGLEGRFGPASGDELDCGYHVSAPIICFRGFGYIEKLKTVRFPRKPFSYTVTLRNYDRQPYRNSDIDAWLRFAGDIGAVVIEDYGDKKIDILDRMALYAGADMNFGPGGGPMALCWYSDFPYLTFSKNANPLYHTKHLWPVGTQLPWKNRNQKNIWGQDSYEDIVREWEIFKGELDGKEQKLHESKNLIQRTGERAGVGNETVVRKSRHREAWKSVTG